MNRRQMKLNAAVKALEYVKDGMIIGLGSGSTAEIFLEKLAEKVRNDLNVAVIPSSLGTEIIARQHGLKIVSLQEYPEVDLAVDGADIVDEGLNLIKGGGAAMAREKVVDYAAKKFIVIVDKTKLSSNLYDFPVPIEVLPFALGYVLKKLEKYGAPSVRMSGKGKYGPVITDNGNLIVDLTVKIEADPSKLEREINTIPGVVENGIFPAEYVDLVIVGREDGATVLSKK